MLASSLALLGASLLSWALLLVISRAILVAFEFDPWLFTLIQMMVGGALLIAIAGPSVGLLGALRNPYTWAYGVLRVATAAFFTAALLHTTAANAAFLGVVSVPISMIVLWLVLSRKPSRIELPGHALILLGLVLLAQTLEGGWSNSALIFMIASELCVVASTMIAEVHPLNQTDDTRQRARLTGIMLIASALFMLMAGILLGFFMQLSPGVDLLQRVSPTWVVDPVLIIDARLWIYASLVGFLLRGPSLFLSLMAIHRVRTENYIAGMAALPFMSLGLEAAAAALGWLAPPSAASAATAFGTLMTIGSLCVLWARSKRKEAARTSVGERTNAKGR